MTFTRRESAAHDRLLDPPADDPAAPDCPVCGHPTDKWEPGYMDPDGWNPPAARTCSSCAAEVDGEDE